MQTNSQQNPQNDGKNNEKGDKSVQNPPKPQNLCADGWLTEEIRIITPEEIQQFFTKEEERQNGGSFKDDADYYDFTQEFMDFFEDAGMSDALIDMYEEFAVKPLAKWILKRDAFITSKLRRGLKMAWKPFGRRTTTKYLNKYANEQPLLFGLFFTFLITMGAMTQKTPDQRNADWERENRANRAKVYTDGDRTVIDVEAEVIDTNINAGSKPSQELLDLITNAWDMGVKKYKDFLMLYKNFVSNLSENSYNRIIKDLVKKRNEEILET